METMTCPLMALGDTAFLLLWCSQVWNHPKTVIPPTLLEGMTSHLYLLCFVDSETAEPA